MKKVSLYPQLFTNDKISFNNVMVIDDDSVCHLIISLLIKSSGFAIKQVAFYNAEEALQELSDCYNKTGASPDFIFLDINMPGMNGWEFLRKYNELPKGLLNQTKIIMLSSSDCDTDTQQAIANEHVYDYIVKPISIDKLDALRQKTILREAC